MRALWKASLVVAIPARLLPGLLITNKALGKENSQLLACLWVLHLKENLFQEHDKQAHLRVFPVRIAQRSRAPVSKYLQSTIYQRGRECFCSATSGIWQQHGVEDKLCGAFPVASNASCNYF